MCRSHSSTMPDNVTLRGRSSKDNISCPLHISETVEEKFYEILYKYRALSDDVQRIRTITPFIFLTELFPFANLTMIIVFAQ